MAATLATAATPVSTPRQDPDFLAHRLHRSLSALSGFCDSVGDDYIQIDRNDLWALFAVLTDEAERVHEATLSD